MNDRLNKIDKNDQETQWQLSSYTEIPLWFLTELKTYSAAKNGQYIAQILWQRDINTIEKLTKFLSYESYLPASSFEFEPEMSKAINRFTQAIQQQEKIAIWGDFDADGITSTCVLWEGLGQFFQQNINLKYYIPNRFTESHGLNIDGINKLAEWSVNLIVTCDTGSTNLTEINYANELGIDIIITDHHTLPDVRPNVISIINPRYLAKNHPLYHFSGVAVAYKLIEALCQSFPNFSSQSSEELLDLVAIGLIADLVNLSGDCRYLAQKGIEKLQNTKRIGVKKLLELCKAKGDRPTDISFGIGPRINAVSRIHGKADFCVKLLTSKDEKICDKLAEETELANTRRKELQNKVLKEAKEEIENIDLSSTGVIVLVNNQWESGVLGLVANSIAQEYGKPTILLTTAQQNKKNDDFDYNNTSKIARGSARSVNNIDLYELVLSQANLLLRFGGHPYAAGLTINVENISFFTEAINQKLRQKLDINLLKPIIKVDLIVTVKELGKDLFKELKLLEPCGMGNPVGKLLIKNCWFNNIWNKNEIDKKGKKGKQVKYIKTNFEMFDDSQSSGFKGVWWGHYQDELIPNQRYDVIVELDYNAYEEDYEVRIIDLKINQKNETLSPYIDQNNLIIDSRNKEIQLTENTSSFRVIKQCPSSWHNLESEYQKALSNKQKLALAYQPTSLNYPQEIWLKLLGIVKYLLRTNQGISKQKLCANLNINSQSLDLGLKALQNCGIKESLEDNQLKFVQESQNLNKIEVKDSINIFIQAIQENKFKEEYFYKVSLSTLEGKLYKYI